MKYFSRVNLLILLFLVLSGCTIKPNNTPHLTTESNEQFSILSQLTMWEIKGKIAFKHPEQSVSANMKWQNSPVSQHFTLTNFLGVTLADLQVKNGKATLKANGESYNDTQADRLLYNITGIAIPLQALAQWIKALPQVDDLYELNDIGQVVQLEPQCNTCKQWTVHYNNYQLVEGIWLPREIKLTHKYQLKHWIKIKVSKWQI